MLALAIVRETVERLNKPLIERQKTGTIQCTSCGEHKLVSEFHRNRRKSGGYNFECKECCKIRIERWRKDNPEKMREIWNRDKRRRRALTASSAPYLLPDKFDELKQEFNHTCAYCGEHKELFQDHVIPIGSGNSGSYVVPACKECNSSKGNMDFKQWYKDQDFYSNERYDKVISCQQ